MAKTFPKSLKSFLMYNRLLTSTVIASSLAFAAAPAMAQQSGTVIGNVTGSNGSGLSGVTVEARSAVLPGVRSATTQENGRYQLPLLPPGQYTLTFENSDGVIIERQAFVSLSQRISVDVAFDGGDEVVVTSQRIALDTGQASLGNSLGIEAIEGVPLGQEYRDLQKLIPGVQYTEDTVRGPSAGGSGQDNVYQFDGVDVSLPLFGTLASDPSTHDIDQVSIVRGGAKAIGFNRSGGFTINTISKRGTNEFSGRLQYQAEFAGLQANRKDEDSVVDFNEDRRWITASLGGPIVEDKLFFYGSYYRPTISRKQRENALGELPEFKSERDEFFGKLTWAPTNDILLDASLRSSDLESRNSGIGAFDAVSMSRGNDSKFQQAILEGSWVIDDVSNASFKYTNFKNDTAGRPDTLFDVDVSFGAPLPVNSLDSIGSFTVPLLRDGEADYNAFVQPIIDQFGNVAGGGGRIGGSDLINEQDFARESIELTYGRTFNLGDTTHDIHIGFQRQEISEDLARTSNGFGRISVPGGRTFADDGVTPVFYEARVFQTGIVGGNGDTIVPRSIKSEATLQSFEINDTIEKGDFTFNLGVLISNDILYGQGLREAAGTVSGFEVAPGNKYKMYETDWEDMIQPRVGVNWDYDDRSSVFANYARYHPSASSLARAASWDRNLSRELRLRYDAQGNFIESSAVRSSSGKVFADGLKPRKIDEYLIGWEQQATDELRVRASGRYRQGNNFWEDTNNTARLFGNAPADIQALGLYVPNLDEIRAEIGGSSYVIAQLDNAETRYYEAAFEAEYNTEKWYLQASYVLSSYKGNFDQDNTTTNNDQNIFIGSSNIADGPGRQLWDNKEGTLKGDRPHQFKLFGFYRLPWNAQVGGYAAYQSGQPWEAWDVEVYRAFTGSGSSTIRYAEPAGSRRTDSHFQLDMNYVQNFEVLGGYNIQLRADLFNVLNSQTGYNIQPNRNSLSFGEPLSFYNPRRLQLAVKAEF
ncbi:carboxypeptidase regulatory-like domain-containing protein [Fretibacter rubidus]|uniref:carboxypeptidase regulatory-like domain-containing protein n=1 Tax=Fretibacter rubidus TaxID=570162 RepID=UPI003529EF6E